MVPTTVDETRKRDAVDAQWLTGILEENGYHDIKQVATSPATVAGFHQTRLNVILTVHPELGLITVLHASKMKKGGFGAHKDILEKLNKANQQSWRDTFYLDKDGDLAISAYITLGDEIPAKEIADFLEAESQAILQTVVVSGLREHLQ